MIEFRKKEKDSSILDIAPLVDMVFLLLIFFLLTNTYQKYQLKVSIPETTSGVESKETPETYTIEIRKNGTIYLNGKAITLNELSKIPKTAEVDIAADKDVSYQTVISVLDRLNEAGIKNVNLLTTKK